MLTAKEVAQNAINGISKYKYVFGAKGEVCSLARINQLIQAYWTTYFSKHPGYDNLARNKAGYLLLAEETQTVDSYCFFGKKAATFFQRSQPSFL